MISHRGGLLEARKAGRALQNTLSGGGVYSSG